MYINQLLNSGVKIYMISRLSKQRWFNRSDQGVTVKVGIRQKAQNFMACYLTVVYLVAFLIAIMGYSQIVPTPRLTLLFEMG